MQGGLLPSFLYINHQLFNPFFHIFISYFSLPRDYNLCLFILALVCKLLFTVYHDHLEHYYCPPKSLHIFQFMTLLNFLLNPSS